MLELEDVIIYKAKEAAFSVGRRGYYSHFYSIRLKPIKIEKLKPISPCFRFIWGSSHYLSLFRQGQ